MNGALKRAHELLAPQLQTREARQALFAQAFYPDHQAVFNEIDFSGPTNQFVNHCTTALDGYGAIDGRLALCRLLKAAQSRVGPQKQAEFEEVMRALGCCGSPGKTVVCVDLARYGAISRYLEKDLKLGAEATLILNKQIEKLIRGAVADAHADYRRVLVKNTGDGAILCFDAPDAAVVFGEALHRQADDAYNREAVRGEEYRCFRVGIYSGEVLLTNDEIRISGIAVGCASRLEAKARTGEILLDGESWARLPTAQQAAYGDEESVPGKEHEPAITARRRKVSESAPWEKAPPDIREDRHRYLEELKAWLEGCARLYSPLAGDAEIRKRRRMLPAATPSPLFKHFRKLTEDMRKPEPGEQKEYEDILAAFDELGRAALVGEPGAGKTTALIRLAQRFLSDAEKDLEAPLPLLAELREWLDPDESLEKFLAGQAGALAERLPALMAENKVVLLLDGLNEIPTVQQVAKAKLIRELLKNERLKIVVSCRERDYRGELVFKHLDKLAIRPLTPTRIQAFIRIYMNAVHEDEAQGRAQAERLFWLMAGGEEVRDVWQAWQKAGVGDPNIFWNVEEIPRENPDVYGTTSGEHDKVWQERVKDARSLIRLASNPFMLWMLIAVYCDTEHLPANRASLFDTFIKMLLAREGLANEESFEVFPEGEALLDALGRIAWRMQLGAHERGEDSVQVSLLPEDIKGIADDKRLYRAASASLLETGGQVRFSHQLLQEYFVARQMKVLLDQGQLDAAKLWPEQWERTGWEESSVLLAGLYAEDCTPVIKWLQDIQPEVALDCINRSGANVPRETLKRLRAMWVPRLTDSNRYPDPRARAAFGRALGSLELDGYPLDNRPGVWGIYLPNENRAEVDIEWVEVEGGEFIYQDGERRELETFYMSRYPVTHSQFQAFVDDPDGYANDAWWKDLERSDAAEAAEWTFHNHPRETVDWYEAVAFCRWLSALRREEITLPTEWQWERAARGRDGRQYPWGDDYRSGYANIDETYENAGEFNLEQTSVVGMYPPGRAEHGDQSIDDLAGNVWEWCLNKYDKPKNIAIDQSGGARVVRGGSWLSARSSARAVFRSCLNPLSPNALHGFRLVRLAPHL